MSGTRPVALGSKPPPGPLPDCPPAPDCGVDATGSALGWVATPCGGRGGRGAGGPKGTLVLGALEGIFGGMVRGFV